MTPTPDTTARTETAETVTVPYDDFHAAYRHVPRSRMFPDACLKTRLRTLLHAEDVAHADEAEAIALASPQHPVGVREARSIRDFAQAILHGDDDHRGWLEEAAECFVTGQPMPEPRGKGTASATLFHPPTQDAPGAVKVLEALRGYEALEADIILNADWSSETPRLTQAQWDEVIRLQALRNAVLAATSSDASKPAYWIVTNANNGQTIIWTDDELRARRAHGQYAGSVFTPLYKQPPAAITDDDRRYVEEVELQEIADGAWGGGPARRGAARDRLAALDPSPPLPEADGEVVAYVVAMRDRADVLDRKYGAANAPEVGMLRRSADALSGDVLDMAAIGRSFMASLNTLTQTEGAYKGWTPAEDPAELVLDLYNDLEEERAAREKAEQVAAGLRDLEAIRADGWMVAVHNDYRLHGEPHTFWLFTHADGRWVKGEGRTDAEALAQACAALRTSASTEEPSR